MILKKLHQVQSYVQNLRYKNQNIYRTYFTDNDNSSRKNTNSKNKKKTKSLYQRLHDGTLRTRNKTAVKEPTIELAVIQPPVEIVHKIIHEEKEEEFDSSSPVSTAASSDMLGFFDITDNISENYDLTQSKDSYDSKFLIAEERALQMRKEIVEKPNVEALAEWEKYLEFSNNGLLIAEAYSKYFGPCVSIDLYTNDIITRINNRHKLNSKKKLSNIKTSTSTKRRHSTNSISVKSIASAMVNEQQLPIKFVRINMNEFELMLNQLKAWDADIRVNTPAMNRKLRNISLAGLGNFQRFSSPLPTFLFFRDGKKVCELKGANVEQLRKLTQHWSQKTACVRPQTSPKKDIYSSIFQPLRNVISIKKAVEEQQIRDENTEEHGVRAHSVPEPFIARIRSFEKVGVDVNLDGDNSVLDDEQTGSVSESDSEEIQYLISKLRETGVQWENSQYLSQGSSNSSRK